MIPKIIHLCWFSNDPYPVEIKVCLDTWKKLLPDFQVKVMMIVLIGDHEGLAADRKPICASPAAKGIVSDKQFTPFIVVNAPVGGIYNKVMGQIDQYPTILNLMHLDRYEWKGMGQSILDPKKYPAAVGSDNMNVETSGNVPSQEIERLTKAHRISDLLIRYDKILKTLEMTVFGH